MGIDARHTRRMMNESLDVIIPLLEGERVNAKTDWFTLCDAKLQHASYTKPRMEMAVTSVRSPAGALLAGCGRRAIPGGAWTATSTTSATRWSSAGRS